MSIIDTQFAEIEIPGVIKPVTKKCSQLYKITKITGSSQDLERVSITSVQRAAGTYTHIYSIIYQLYTTGLNRL